MHRQRWSNRSQKRHQRIPSGVFGLSRDRLSNARLGNLAFAACLDIKDQQKYSGDEYKQKARDKTKIINLHSCLVRKSSAKNQHLPQYQRANRFRRLNEECFKFRYITGSVSRVLTFWAS
jgi:hypothetical protein